jgi:general secretion pathway protein D
MAVGGGVVDEGEALPGSGVSVVPLRFTSVATMTKLLSGFIAETDGLRIDPGRNAILIRGPAPNREEVVRAIESFDTDWMRNQSVSLVEARRARVDTVVAELTRIFDNENNGNGSGLIQFKPISRMRAILIISKNPALIRRAETWIRRLDQESDRAADNVFVYRPRHRDAKELARLVSSLFKNGGTGSTDSPGGAGLGGGLSTTPFGSGSQDGGGREGGGMVPGGAQSSMAQPGSAARSGGLPMAPASAEAFTLDPVQNEGESGRGGQSRRMALTVNADPANNTVVSYTDGETYQKVLAVLRSLDVAPTQVAINVTIAEVQLNDALKYGVQFFLRSNRVGLGTNKGSISLADTAEQILTRKLPGFNFVGGGNSPDVVISALDSISKVQVLSSPSLVVMENKPAVLQVGDQVPITTRQGQSVVNIDAPVLNQIEFKDTGIILKLIPRVGQSDTVTLDVEQEISNVSKGENTLTPTISRRRVSSSLTINNGQTVLLAGMISENRHAVRDGIPYLARSLIGDLFGSTNNGIDRTELVMFIRPVVVRDGEDAASVAEEFRSRLKFSGRPRVDAPVRAIVQKQ